ncbi:hypothetical protein ACSFB7_15900 [Variovorax sp. GB1P17]
MAEQQHEARADNEKRERIPLKKEDATDGCAGGHCAKPEGLSGRIANIAFQNEVRMLSMDTMVIETRELHWKPSGTDQAEIKAR